jgi:predicted alpha/beta-hydrolase family hydrolase
MLTQTEGFANCEQLFNILFHIQAMALSGEMRNNQNSINQFSVCLHIFLTSEFLKSFKMKSRSLSLKISDAIGSVSAECIVPKESKCIMTLAHGAGAGMHHEFMIRLSQSLSEVYIATLRFNFPFMENKKARTDGRVGLGRPDTPAVAHATIEKAIEKALKLFPKLPCFAAGKSFGGRMTSQFLSITHDMNVKGIVFYGFPLHAPGKPSIERAEHLRSVRSPMLFLQGSRDEFATWKLIQSVCSELQLAELIKIEGANHSFKAGKQNIIQLLADETSKWIEKKIMMYSKTGTA